MKYDVCEITTIHPQDDARVLRSINALAEHYSNIVFVSSWSDRSNVRDNVTIRTTNIPVARSGRFLYGLKIFLKVMRIDSFVYHFHDLDFLPYAVLLRLIKRRPVIYDCHENYPEEILNNKPWIPIFLRGSLAQLVRKIENISVNYIKNVIVVTPAQYDRFSQHTSHVYIVRNFSDINIDKSENGKAVIFTGGLGPTYGVQQLLQIAKGLKPHGIPLIITDRFSDKVEEKHFKEVVESNNLQVEFVEKVPASQMQTLLKRARIGLSPSQVAPNTMLGHHSKLIEYMACGLPIVASRVEANTFVLKKVNCGIIVEPQDIEGYINAIIAIYTNTTLYNNMRDSGFNAISKEFNWNIEKYQLLKAVGESI